MTNRKRAAVSLVLTFAVLGAGLAFFFVPTEENHSVAENEPDASNVSAGSAADEMADLAGDDPKRFVDCASQPTKVMRIACRVGSAAHAVAQNYPSGDFDKREVFKAFAAIEAATVVRSSLSTGRYSYLKAYARDQIPLGSEMCLDVGAGICGNHVEAFRDIMAALGIRTRPVSFFYTTDGLRESHIATEVYYLNAWRFIDVTWGFAVSQDGSIMLKSISEIRGNPSHTRMENAFDVWSMFVRAARGDPMEYLYRRDVDVLVNGKGIVTLAVPADTPAHENFDNVPNYVGDTTTSHKRNPTALRFVAEGRYRVSLEISGVAGCKPEEGDALEVDGRKLSLSDASSITFDIDREALLSMRTTQPTCYAVFSQARYEALH
ncbi:transglutaminase domain-containing protein [Hyphomicrobium nitrativorans]|uniref:transglutaminase domain-containing protein n=1 Tax=Hyphomicrobium nitrativorans TaxID=1427356 RepID=UPI001183038F|nr:transglutaminase domain-containing protein [Hyphomicrobium nitrativorans]